MDLTGQILEQAMGLFDSAGVVAEEAGMVLILGLASTPKRDLDEMMLHGDRLRLHGWVKHVKPRLIALRDLITEKGFEAEAVGWWGYPMAAEVMHLKRLAVMAGLGGQGKNTLVLHPQFGPWLRLAAIRTNAPLTATGPGVYERCENPLCQSCDVCINVCPVKGLLEPYRLLDPARCLVNVESNLARSELGRCAMVCVTMCPVGR